MSIAYPKYESDMVVETAKIHIGEYLKIAANSRIPSHLLDRATIHAALDNVSEELLVRVETYVESMKHQTEKVEHKGPRKILTWKVPSGWWQHFKADLFPKWMREMFPIKYEEIDTMMLEEIHTVCNITNVCPQLDTGKTRGDDLRYFRFLLRGE